MDAKLHQADGLIGPHQLGSARELQQHRPVFKVISDQRQEAVPEEHELWLVRRQVDLVAGCRKIDHTEPQINRDAVQAEVPADHRVRADQQQQAS